jgi:anti-sigma-K factor RskA
MIPEEQQDQAALYALGLLDADKTVAFESALSTSTELRNFVRELCEAAADVALTAPVQSPPAALKWRVIGEIERQTKAPTVLPTRRSSSAWVPWAIAAILMVFCGLLAFDRARLQREIAAVRGSDPLMQTIFFTLTPSGPVPADAKAVVAWQPGRQTGVIRISNLPAPESGRDYQLWAVDAAHKDPISAGVIHVNENGVAQIRFKPVEMAQQVKAFAISLEREGGVPKKEGPIVLAGTA